MIPKFRVWKKTNTPEMFRDIAGINFNKNKIFINYKVSNWHTRLDVEPLDNVILMQSTGLFDKNGKEIFEGDVVRMHSGELLPVKLHHGMFEPVCYYISNVFERVGNVFENPELLEHPDFRGVNIDD
ncbi:TPA: YopX family protein [Streptococcus suis]